MSRLDELSPTYMGEDRIRLSLDATTKLLVGKRITVEIDYSDADPSGVEGPIVATATPANEGGFRSVRRVFRKPPRTFTFPARVAGEYLVVVRESAHNRWQGRLLVSVAGETIERGRR